MQALLLAVNIALDRQWNNDFFFSSDARLIVNSIKGVSDISWECKNDLVDFVMLIENCLNGSANDTMIAHKLCSLGKLLNIGQFCIFEGLTKHEIPYYFFLPIKNIYGSNSSNLWINYFVFTLPTLLHNSYLL